MGEEAEEAQHPQIVFRDTLGGIADKADVAFLDVGKPADEIDHVTLGIGIERIDRQIPPLGINFPVRPEGYLGAAAIGLDVAAQRRHLERRALDDQRHRAVVDARRDRL